MRGVIGRRGRREGAPVRHAFEADIAGDAAFEVEEIGRSERALTAAKAWHPLSLPRPNFGMEGGTVALTAARGGVKMGL